MGIGPAEALVLLFILAIIALSLGTAVFWIWMLIDCAMNESSESNEKLIWILIILFTHLIGALIYYLVRRPKRLSELGR